MEIQRMCNVEYGTLGSPLSTPGVLWLQVCDGATDEERQEWELLPADQFKYLNKSSTYNLAGVNNAEEYRVRAARTSPHPPFSTYTSTHLCQFPTAVSCMATVQDCKQ